MRSPGVHIGPPVFVPHVPALDMRTYVKYLYKFPSDARLRCRESLFSSRGRGGVMYSQGFTLAYSVVALIASGLCGRYAFEMHTFTTWNDVSKAKRYHQFCFNFLGSLFGWAVALAMLRRFGDCWLSQCSRDITQWDLIGGLIAFIGVSGYLPYATMLTVKGLRSLITNMLKPPVPEEKAKEAGE
jgi:hypothetical protein